VLLRIVTKLCMQMEHVRTIFAPPSRPKLVHIQRIVLALEDAENLGDYSIAFFVCNFVIYVVLKHAKIQTCIQYRSQNRARESPLWATKFENLLILEIFGPVIHKYGPVNVKFGIRRGLCARFYTSP